MSWRPPVSVAEHGLCRSRATEASPFSFQLRKAGTSNCQRQRPHYPLSGRQSFFIAFLLCIAPLLANALPAVDVAAGSDFALAVLSDGSVRAWGNAANAGRTNLPSLNGAVDKVSAGNQHGIALLKDGSVRAWGCCDRATVVAPRIGNNGRAIDAGLDFNWGILKDGSVIDITGDGTENQGFVAAQGNNAYQISAGASHVVVVRNDGSIAAEGDPAIATVPGFLSGSKNIQAVSAGWKFTLVLMKDGTVQAWGDGANGKTSVPSGLSNVKQVSAGWEHSLAVLDDGTVRCWGKSSECNLPSGLSNVAQVAAGESFSLARLNDGSVRAWGSNNNGALNVPPEIAPLQVLTTTTTTTGLTTVRTTSSTTIANVITSFTTPSTTSSTSTTAVLGGVSSSFLVPTPTVEGPIVLPPTVPIGAIVGGLIGGLALLGGIAGFLLYRRRKQSRDEVEIKATPVYVEKGPPTGSNGIESSKASAAANTPINSTKPDDDQSQPPPSPATFNVVSNEPEDPQMAEYPPAVVGPAFPIAALVAAAAIPEISPHPAASPPLVLTTSADQATPVDRAVPKVPRTPSPAVDISATLLNQYRARLLPPTIAVAAATAGVLSTTNENPEEVKSTKAPVVQSVAEEPAIITDLPVIDPFAPAPDLGLPASSQHPPAVEPLIVKSMEPSVPSDRIDVDIAALMIPQPSWPTRDMAVSGVKGRPPSPSRGTASTAQASSADRKSKSIEPSQEGGGTVIPASIAPTSSTGSRTAVPSNAGSSNNTGSSKQALNSKSGTGVDPTSLGVPAISKLQVTPLDIEIDYLKPLGEGSFGTVYHGRLRGTVKVAVKTLKGVDKKAADLFAREVRTWEGLVQRNVMPLMAFCLDPPMMVCEVADGGNMRQYLDARSWDQMIGRRFMLEVAAGMTYLHSLNILHGDLKALNVLVDGGRAMITDFGLSQVRHDMTSIGTSMTNAGLAGTPGFMAPGESKNETRRLATRSNPSYPSLQKSWKAAPSALPPTSTPFPCSATKSSQGDSTRSTTSRTSCSFCTWSASIVKDQTVPMVFRTRFGD